MESKIILFLTYSGILTNICILFTSPGHLKAFGTVVILTCYLQLKMKIKTERSFLMLKLSYKKSLQHLSIWYLYDIWYIIWYI